MVAIAPPGALCLVRTRLCLFTGRLVTERADLPSQLACLPSGRSRSMANRDRGLPRVSRISAELIARVHAPENCNRMLLCAKVH
jgi:hypothetical protein